VGFTGVSVSASFVSAVGSQQQLNICTSVMYTVCIYNWQKANAADASFRLRSDPICTDIDDKALLERVAPKGIVAPVLVTVDVYNTASGENDITDEHALLGVVLCGVKFG